MTQLKYIAFSSETVRWFESYLKKQNFILSLHKSLSEPDPLDFDGPEGSMLGLALFLMYVYDMKSTINNCNLAFFLAMKMLVILKIPNCYL